LALGEGHSVDNLIHYHLLKTTNDERIGNLNYGEFVQAKLNGDYEF